MKRQALNDVLKSGVSIFDTSALICYFKINDDERMGYIVKSYGEEESGLKIVMYRKERYYRITKGCRQYDTYKLDLAKHLRRLAIVTDEGKAILSDLLYISDFFQDVAVACCANGDMVLLNKRGKIVWNICKRRDLKNVTQMEFLSFLMKQKALFENLKKA